MYCNLVEAVADVDDKLWRCCLGNVLLYQTPTVIQTHSAAPSCSTLHLNTELNIAASYVKRFFYWISSKIKNEIDKESKKRL